MTKRHENKDKELAHWLGKDVSSLPEKKKGAIHKSEQQKRVQAYNKEMERLLKGHYI